MGWPLQHASRHWRLRRAGGPLRAARPLRAQLHWELELQASSPVCMELELSHACTTMVELPTCPHVQQQDHREPHLQNVLCCRS